MKKKLFVLALLFVMGVFAFECSDIGKVPMCPPHQTCNEYTYNGPHDDVMCCDNCTENYCEYNGICDTTCATDPDCTDPNQCATDNYCNPLCAIDLDCDTYDCITIDNYCDQTCTNDPDCDTTYDCSTSDNECDTSCNYDPDCDCTDYEYNVCTETEYCNGTTTYIGTNEEKCCDGTCITTTPPITTPTITPSPTPTTSTYSCEWSWPQKIKDSTTNTIIQTCPITKPYCNKLSAARKEIQCCETCGANAADYTCTNCETYTLTPTTTPHPTTHPCAQDNECDTTCTADPDCDCENYGYIQCTTTEQCDGTWITSTTDAVNCCNGTCYSSTNTTQGNCWDDQDNDNDEKIDEKDMDCYDSTGTYDPHLIEYTQPITTPIVTIEPTYGNCGDNKDNDNDGYIDKNDPDCMGPRGIYQPTHYEYTVEVGTCGDEIDNDEDN